MDERVKITRVKAELKHFIKSVSLRQLMVRNDDMRNVPRFCRAVKKVLRQYDHPILITRAMPLTSVIVGLKTRRYASKWISHFSDPMPCFPPKGKVAWLNDYLTRRWMKKAIAAADVLSVTCPLAVRYYQETYAKEAAGKKFVVALHIGDHKLGRAPEKVSESVFARPVILLPGDIYEKRGDAIFESVDRLNASGTPCLFVMDRPPWPEVVRHFRETPNALSLGIRGGGAFCRNLNATASVVFVADFIRDLDYSPYLMSKFVYQVYEDRPIVVYAKSESCMADYCRRYPEAGLFFAEAGDLESLIAALKQALVCDVSQIRREAIRREFAAEAVAKKFMEDIEG